MFLERRSANTGENALFRYELVKSMKIDARSILLITKPYMERRALATFEAQWSNKSAGIAVSSRGGSINKYCVGGQIYDDVVNIMVGDFQRLVEYPKLGFQSAQPIAAKQHDALKRLVAAGYTKHLFV